MADSDLIEIRLRLRNTFSFWATVTGIALAVVRPTRRLGAVLLLLVGYGGIGVAWERAYQCDLRLVRGHRPTTRAISGFASHAPLALAGHLLLHRTRR